VEGSSETWPCGAAAARGPLADWPPGGESSMEDFICRISKTSTYTKVGIWIGTFASGIIILSTKNIS
jgi:hypothetical protein